MSTEASGPEAVAALHAAMATQAPVYLAHGQVADDDGAIEWIDGQGLYAEVVLATKPFHGERCKAAVGGALLDVAPGTLHSRPLHAGDHVLVALVEGTPGGHAVILSRVPTSATAPAEMVAGRAVTERNVSRTAFDLFGPGESWHVGLQGGGSMFVRFEGEGRLAFLMPDGATLAFDAGAWKVRSKDGASVQVGPAVTLRSPSGQSWLEVTDEGVFAYGPKVDLDGRIVRIGNPSDPMAAGALTSIPATPLVSGSSPGGPLVPPVRASKKVLIGG